jgi:hypothetical protein
MGTSAPRNLDQVKAGQSTKEEVRALLGAPAGVSKDPVWGETWQYPGLGALGASQSPPAQISFGPDGKVWRVSVPSTVL